MTLTTNHRGRRINKIQTTRPEASEALVKLTTNVLLVFFTFLRVIIVRIQSLKQVIDITTMFSVQDSTCSVNGRYQFFKTY